jgi:hypothetical protein
VDSAKRVISGTWGEVWLNGDYVGECFKFQAKIAFTREDVPMAGNLTPGKKLMKTEKTGSMTLHKVNSRMAILIGDQIKAGHDPSFTVISKIDDPDAYGAERISCMGVLFDDLTLADWEVAVKGQTEHPFTYMDYEFLDKIGA